MTDQPFSAELLDLIDEDLRLLALHDVCDVGIEHDQVANEWVLNISPKDGPYGESLRFEPYTRFNLHGVEINGAVREGWSVVARAAQLTNTQTLTTIVPDLQSTIPEKVSQEPALTHWLPTDEEGVWESTQRYDFWKVGPVSITRAKHYAQLVRKNDHFDLLLPNDLESDALVAIDQPEAYRIPATKAEAGTTSKPCTRPLDSPKATLHVDEFSLAQQPLLKEEPIVKQRTNRDKPLERPYMNALLDPEEDIAVPKRIGGVIGAIFFMAILIYIFSTDPDSDAGTIFLLICLGIWIVKKAAMYVADLMHFTAS